MMCSSLCLLLLLQASLFATQKTIISAGTDQDPNRLVSQQELVDRQSVLSQSLNEIQRLARRKSQKSTLKDLCVVFASLAKLPARQLPASASDARAVSAVVRAASELFGNYTLPVGHRSQNITYLTVTIVVYNMSAAKGYSDEVQVFSSNTFDVTARCFVNAGVRVAFVVYPDDSSPLRPLPDVGFPLTGFNIVDVIIVSNSDTKIGYTKQCGNDIFFDTLLLTRAFEMTPFAVKHGCASWDEVKKNWTTENCFLFTSYDISYVYDTSTLCYCDTKSNDELATSTYILFDYAEDVQQMAGFSEVVSKVENTSDLLELRRYERLINDLADQTANTPSLNTFVTDHLHSVLQFNSSLLERNSSAELLVDIGRIFARIKPSREDSIIGHGTNLTTAFVLSLDTYKLAPLIAFAFHSTPYWMEYYRASESIDLNTLFDSDVVYSFMFSTSVLDQNARYGFILYPLNKFFKPTGTIVGHNVKMYQVLDVCLEPEARDDRRLQDQFVHLYFLRNVTDMKMFEYGCAYWSASLANWTTVGCSPNPELYRSVCTCNMSAHFGESRGRGQYVVYRYQDVVERVVEKNDYQELDSDVVYTSIFRLHVLRRYVGRKSVFQQAIAQLVGVVMTNFDDTLRLDTSVKGQLINDAREIGMNFPCESSRPEGYQSDGIEAVCYEKNSTSQEDKFTFFWYDINLYPGALTLDGGYTDTRLFTRNSLFSVHVSDSVSAQNDKFVFIVYPMDNSFLRPLPSVGYSIVNSRMVDLILVPKMTDGESAEQFVEIYLDQTAFICTHECAYWDVQLDAWSTQGCGRFKVNGLDVCNCSLSVHFNQSRSGGQYIAYTYTTVLFEENVYLRLGSQSLKEARSIFSQGSALIHNASLIPVNETLICKTLAVYLRMMAVDANLLLKHHSEIVQIVRDLQVMFDRYLIDNTKEVNVNYGIQGSWSAKSSAVSKDLFSNAVLSSNDTSDVSFVSHMTVVGFGYYSSIDWAHDMPSTFQFQGHEKELLETATSKAPKVIIKNKPSFACVKLTLEVLCNHRFIFTVYPLNTSPYPQTMTAKPIFNFRQMDAYKSTDRLEFLYSWDYEKINSTVMELYFRPTADPPTYITIGCASWNDGSDGWTTDVCSMVRLYGADICRCELINRTLTRVIMFEYTDMANFSWVSALDASSIVYLVGACMSMFGFVVILITSMLFAKWRKDLSNKILMNLSLSSFLYLSLTMFRETHLIYANKNHTNIPLIVFTVCVHYTRLAHFCWGLALSTLQYKRFSGVVGATTVHHLLLKICMVTWGVPLVPIIVLLLWDQSVHFCGPDKLTHYALYLVPGAVITFLNIGILVAILGKITNNFGCGNEADLQRHNLPDKDLIKRRMKTVVLMFFLFGIPTVFEMFNDIVAHSEAVTYITKLLDPVQGFVLFLFFVVFDDKSRRCWGERTNGLIGSSGTRTASSDSRSLSTVKVSRRLSRVTVRTRRGPRDTVHEEIEMKQLGDSFRQQEIETCQDVILQKEDENLQIKDNIINQIEETCFQNEDDKLENNDASAQNEEANLPNAETIIQNDDVNLQNQNDNLQNKENVTIRDT